MNCSSNIKNISNANVASINVKTIFNPYLGIISFDTSNSNITIPANTNGFAFEVVTPTGETIGGTNIVINTSINQTSYTLNGLRKGDLYFGDYKVKTIFTDNAGTHTLEQSINICKPSILNKSNLAEGKFEVDIDCINAVANFVDKTNYKVDKLDKITTTYNLTIKDTEGNVENYSSGNVSYSLNEKYTGIYLLQCKSVVLYEIGCGASLQIEFNTNKSFNIDCNNNICDLICCWKESEDIVASGGKNSEALKSKMDKLQNKFLLATALDRCGKGKEVKDIVDEIRTALDCSCKCEDKSSIILKRKISTQISDVTFTQSCGTNITDDGNGNYIFSSYFYEIGKLDNSDQSFTINKQINNDCTVQYLLSINVDKLVQNIINELSTNTTLRNSLVQVLGIDSIINTIIDNKTNLNIDWKCIDKQICDYYLDKKCVHNASIFLGITINNIFYPIPQGNNENYVISNTANITSFLNDLNLGTFSYNISVGQCLLNTDRNIEIKSNNLNNITNVIVDSYNLATDTYLQTAIKFNTDCKNVNNTVQHLVNYICAKLGNESTACTLDITNSNYLAVTAVNNTTKKVIGFKFDATLLPALGLGEYYVIRVTNNNPSAEKDYLTVPMYSGIHQFSFDYGLFASSNPNNLKFYISKNCGCCSGGASAYQEIGVGRVNYTEINGGTTGNTPCNPILVASSITNTDVTLDIVNPNGIGTVQYIQVDAQGNIVPNGLGTTAGTSCQINGLTPSTTYYFKAIILGSTNGCNGSYSNTISFSTSGTVVNPTQGYLRVANVSHAQLNAPAIELPFVGTTESMCFTGNGFTQNVYKNTNTPIQTGDTIYNNINLTIVLQGYRHIRDATSNVIYELNISTGVVGQVAYTC